jgi:hypothetical protein
MRNFLAFVGLVVVVILGAGIYNGWFKFNVDSDKNVNISVNGEKAIQDSKRWGEAGLEKGKDLLGNLKKDDAGRPTTTPTPAATAGPTGK